MNKSTFAYMVLGREKIQSAAVYILTASLGSSLSMVRQPQGLEVALTTLEKRRSADGADPQPDPPANVWFMELMKNVGRAFGRAFW